MRSGLILRIEIFQIRVSLFPSMGSYIGLTPILQLKMYGKTVQTFTIFARSNLALVDVLNQHKQTGLSFHWKFYPRDLHGTIPLPSIMDGFIALFEWYQMENTDKFNSFETSKDVLFDIIKYREQKLKSHFGYKEPPYPEEVLTVLGYMSMDTGQPEKSKMFFDLAIEYYPESPNAYDSMADYFERIGDIESAIKFVGKALEISGEESYKTRIERLKERND